MFDATQTINRTKTASVQISGAVLVPTATSRTAAAHAPAPARVAVASETNDTAWYELERVMAARASAMAAHPTAQPKPLRLAS